MSPSGSFLGHPRGLSTLFFTELWERFSYYGMRALLILFMTAAPHSGGLAMSTGEAGAVYGLYTFGVYALALPGGWLADRLIGKKKAVLWGGVAIAFGHFTLAIPSIWTFYTGLVFVAFGTGLLKPSVSALVGDLYPEGGSRRDAGFSIFYMGINIGAFAGPVICSYLAEPTDWHLGFGAAGVGMTVAVVLYLRGAHALGGVGEMDVGAATPDAIVSARRWLVGTLVALVLLTATLVGLHDAGILRWTLVGIAGTTGAVVAVIVVLYFVRVIALVCRDSAERKRVVVIAVLFLGAMMFWAGFEQAGSSMNLFARDLTDRVILGREVPAGMLQSINPLLIILLAPVMGGLWVRLGARSPSVAVKFAWGLAFLGVGFLVLAWGAVYVDDGKVSPAWLVVTYFFHTVGELCLSPIGLGVVTRLSPRRLVSQMMGTWFMGTAIGNLVAGLALGYIGAESGSGFFLRVASIALVTAVLFLVLSVPIERALRERTSSRVAQ